jgi:hypothetical protein
MSLKDIRKLTRSVYDFENFVTDLSSVIDAKPMQPLLTDENITSIQMREARLLLSCGLNLGQVCRQVFGSDTGSISVYTSRNSIKSKTLKRMIEDGALLGGQPLGSYICYLLDKLDEMIAIGASEPHSPQHSAENVALYSARLDLALYNNALAKSHLEQAHSQFNQDSHSSFLSYYERSLYNSYARNESESWVNRRLDPCVGDFGLEEKENRMQGKDQYNHELKIYAEITEHLSS